MSFKKTLSLLTTASTFILEATPKGLSKSREWKDIGNIVLNLLSTCAVVGFVTIGSIEGSENRTDDAYKGLESSILKTQTEVQRQLQTENPNTTRVLVVGVTGSGKSTLVHGLACKELHAKKGSAEYTIDVSSNGDRLPGFNIGAGLNSVTRIPTSWFDSPNNLVYWDCPGFMDSAGPEQEIVNAFAVDHLFVQPNRMKVILAIQESDFETQRGAAALYNLRKLVTLMPDQEQLAKSLCLIVTKKINNGFSAQDKLKDLFQRAGESFQHQQNMDCQETKEEQKKILTLLGFLTQDARHIFTFPRPNGEGIYTGFDDKQNLIRALKENPVANPSHAISLNIDDKVLVYMGNLIRNFGNVESFCSDFANFIQGQYKNSDHEKRAENRTIKDIEKDIKDLQTWEKLINTLSQNIPNSLSGLVSYFKGVPNTIIKEEYLLNLTRKAQQIENFVNFANKVLPYENRKIDISAAIKTSLKKCLEKMGCEVSEMLTNKTLIKDQKIRVSELDEAVKLGKIKQEEANQAIDRMKLEAQAAHEKLRGVQSQLDNAHREMTAAIDKAIQEQKKDYDKKMGDLSKQLEEARSAASRTQAPTTGTSLADLISILGMLNLHQQNSGYGGYCGGGMMSPMGMMPQMPGMMPQIEYPYPSLSSGGVASSSVRRSGVSSGNHAGMVRVSGYTRANGTVVAPHWRSAPHKK